MHTELAITSPASPEPAIAAKPVGADTKAVGGPPAAVTSRGARRPVRFVLAKAMSVLRGDKYMVGAYPTEGPDSLSETPSKGR